MVTCPLALGVPSFAQATEGRPRFSKTRRSICEGGLQTPPRDDALALFTRLWRAPCLRLGENLAWGLSPHMSCAMPGTHDKICRGASRRQHLLLGHS
jgi:hypothetical protein